MIQFHSPAVRDGVRPAVELFSIEAASTEQKQDAGWYYQLSIAGQEIGDPQGPYPSDHDALEAARGMLVE